MNILGIDASEQHCSVALKVHDQFFLRNKMAPRLHAELILPMVDELKKEANIQLSSIDAFAVTIGPGAFTGIRIGMAFIQGLAWSLSKPVIGLSTLKVLAYQGYLKFKVNRVVALMDARMNQVYLAAYTIGNDGDITCDIPEQVCDIAQIPLVLVPWLCNAEHHLAGDRLEAHRWIAVGSGCRYLMEMQNHQAEFVAAKNPLEVDQNKSSILLSPDVAESEFPCMAEHLTALAAHYFLRGVFCSALEVEPLYARNNVAVPSQSLSFSAIAAS
jgi:tRNA threonylcarbamoyl adenosine modification protein YeaZ